MSIISSVWTAIHSHISFAIPLSLFQCNLVSAVYMKLILPISVYHITPLSGKVS